LTNGKGSPWVIEVMVDNSVGFVESQRLLFLHSLEDAWAVDWEREVPRGLCISVTSMNAKGFPLPTPK
jgi:hypothetical protein